MAQNLADLGAGFALQRQPDDLHPVRQHRADIVDHAAQRQRTLVVGPQPGEVAGDGAQPDQEDAAGQVLARQQRPLREGLLAQIGDTLAAEVARAELEQQTVVVVAAMQGQRDGSLVAIRHRLAGRLLGGEGHERDLARLCGGGVGTVEERGIDLLDGLEDGLGLKRRAGQTGDEDLPQLSIERLGLESFDLFLFRMPHAHGPASLPLPPTIGGVPYGKKVGA